MPPGIFGEAVIERQRGYIEAQIGGALNIGMATKNIGAGAGVSDIAGREQQDAACPNIGGPRRVLSLPHRPDQRRRLVLGENFGDVLDLDLGQTGDALDFVGRPLRYFLADIVDAVDPLRNEFLVFPAILEDVPQHPIDRRDVGAGPHADIFGGMRRRPRHPRVDDDHVGAVELLALENVLHRNGMRLGRVAAHDEDRLGIADIIVAVRHSAIAPGIGDARDGGRMTDPRLVVGIIGSPEGGELAVKIGGFVGEFGRTEPVHRVRSRLLADLQQLVANLVDRLIPGDTGPSAVHQLDRVAQAASAQHVVAHRGAFGAVRAPIDRAVIDRLLPDPHAVRDFGEDRTADRAMRANILAPCDRRTRRRRRTGFGLAHGPEWQAAKHR